MSARVRLQLYLTLSSIFVITCRYLAFKIVGILVYTIKVRGSYCSSCKASDHFSNTHFQWGTQIGLASHGGQEIESARCSDRMCQEMLCGEIPWFSMCLTWPGCEMLWRCFAPKSRQEIAQSVRVAALFGWSWESWVTLCSEESQKTAQAWRCNRCPMALWHAVPQWANS
jgi:hypothetical protein